MPGPPMTPSAYNNNVQIVQTPGTVVLLNEMNHSARTVPLDNRPRGNLRRWTGVSRGHWDGATLVVETTNFLRETAFDNGRTDANLQLVERFTRKDPGTLVYEFTVNDPTVYTRPWTAQMTMNSRSTKRAAPIRWVPATGRVPFGWAPISAAIAARTRAAVNQASQVIGSPSYKNRATLTNRVPFAADRCGNRV